MKNFSLITLLFISSFIFNSCNKDIKEPEHKADGSNVVYLKIDDKDEFLLDSRNKRLHKKTAARFDEDDNDIVRFSEFTINGREYAQYTMYFTPFNSKKAEFQKASIILRIDKQTQLLDTAFLRETLTDARNTVISFATKKDEYKSYFIDSIIDYKIIKWDTEKKIFTFSANCTYSHSPKETPANPRIYFYFDIAYEFKS
jgi:hypothetical protein